MRAAGRQDRPARPRPQAEPAGAAGFRGDRLEPPPEVVRATSRTDLEEPLETVEQVRDALVTQVAEQAVRRQDRQRLRRRRR